MNESEKNWNRCAQIMFSHIEINNFSDNCTVTIAAWGSSSGPYFEPGMKLEFKNLYSNREDITTIRFKLMDAIILRDLLTDAITFGAPIIAAGIADRKAEKVAQAEKRAAKKVATKKGATQ